MVNRSRNYTLFFYLFAALLTCSLVMVNHLAMQFRVRADLTADQRFTLSEGTRKLFERLVDPIQVTYYVSAEMPPARVNLERDVVDKLTELRQASGGKLEFTVERIENAQFASKMEELKKFNVVPVADVQTAGEGDDGRVAIGRSGLFSSILVRHGTAREFAVNGVFNLVGKDDETRPNRVDTLEFDIMFALMRMRGQEVKPGLRQMLRSLPEQLSIQVFTSKQMPKNNPRIGSYLVEAARKLEGMGAGKVTVNSRTIPWAEIPFRNMLGQAVLQNITNEPTVDPDEVALPDRPRDPDKQDDNLPDPPPAQPPAEPPAETPPRDPPADPPPRDPPRPDLPPRDPPRPDLPPRDPPPEPPPAPSPARKGPNFYYTILVMSYGDNEDMFHDFRDENSAETCLRIIEDRIWQMVKPRTVLGLITPAAAMDFDPHGRRPQSPYAELTGYIQQHLQYDTREINLSGRDRIPGTLALLVVFEPQRLNERELYEIDRYLAQGGNVVMLYQGWGGRMQLMRADAIEVPLSKNDSTEAFTNWAKHMGVSFGEHFLVHRSGHLLQPFQVVRRTNLVPMPVELPVAINVGPDDIDNTSVFTRGIAGWPMPFACEVKLDDKRLGELKLERADIVRLSGDVYRYLPENERFAALSRSLSFDSRANIQNDPAASPGPETRLQRISGKPVMATLLSGRFTSYWEGKIVPKWQGGSEDERDIGGQPAPEIKGRPGKLVICGSAASLSSDYFYSWRPRDWGAMVVPKTLAFYRNLCEAFIYGDELVSLRTRTGAPPRISGAVANEDRVLWYLLCIAGAPLLLGALGFVRGLYRAKAREEYLLSLKRGQGESS